MLCTAAINTCKTIRKNTDRCRRTRRSSSDHTNDAGRSPSSGTGGYLSVSAARAQAAASGRHRSIADKQETGSMSLPLSIDGTDRRTDARTDTRPLHKRLTHTKSLRPASIGYPYASSFHDDDDDDDCLKTARVKWLPKAMHILAERRTLANTSTTSSRL